MDVTAERVAKVPDDNLRVSRAEFADVWARAEAAVKRPGADADYVVGVVLTCRWLSAQIMPDPLNGQPSWPAAPTRLGTIIAMPETIEDEYLAAVRATVHSRVPSDAAVARGTIATLDWAWRRSGRPPIDVTAAAS